MNKNIFNFSISLLLLVACSKNEDPNSPKDNTGNKPLSEISEWQSSLLGQEGHGGDAIVCFNIPIERALYKVKVNPYRDCTSDEPCQSISKPGLVNKSDSPSSRNSSLNSSNTVTKFAWRMTEEGRKSINSAKPLEQYLGEKIANKKKIIDQLNQLSLQEGYEKILSVFTQLPAPFNRLLEIHQKLGWLQEEGISSEYGLMDINDSGFLNENEIDQENCKELQAVVRRDNQLWYDTDIIKNFDNAGLLLMQLHEEIYAFGKFQDQLNREIHGLTAHETSTKTRRLILKLLDEDINVKILNQNLKDLGFSTMFWENEFNIPTSLGFYMDTEACKSEQSELKDFFNENYKPSEFYERNANFFYSRYLNSDPTGESIHLRHNYPEALSNMIVLVMTRQYLYSRADIMKLQKIFELPESCQGHF